jgi:ABC-type nitrate/sulfonate/bicarbonate transport system permease component
VAHLATARRTSPAQLVDPRVSDNAPVPRRERVPVERWLSAAIAIGVLGLWEVCARTGVINPTFLPAPSSIVRTLVNELVNGVLLVDFSATLLRVIAGLTVGAIPGLLCGLAMGWSPRVRQVIDPFIAALHPVPKLALLPLLMVLLGLSDAPRIAVIALSSFFPMLLAAMAGVRQISPVHFEVARNYGATPVKMLTRVVLPGSLPMVLTGLRLSANTALALAIAVEIATAQTGLGAKVWLSWQILNIELLYATIVLTAVFGFSVNLVLKRLARRFVPWLPDEQPVL